MKKNFFLLTTVLFLLVALALVSGCKKKQDTGEDNVAANEQAMESDEEAGDSEETFFGSLMDLVDRGDSLVCTTAGEDDGVKMEGTTYIYGKKARQSTRIEEDGEKFESNMITDDKTVWIWTDTTPDKGMKFTIDMSDDELKDFSEDVRAAAEEEELAKKFNFKCKKWRVDQSMFDLPSDIEFQDMSAMIDQMKTGAGGAIDDLGFEDTEEAGQPTGDEIPENIPQSVDDMKETLCTMCANAEDQEECRTGLGCE